MGFHCHSPSVLKVLHGNAGTQQELANIKLPPNFKHMHVPVVHKRVVLEIQKHHAHTIHTVIQYDTYIHF